MVWTRHRPLEELPWHQHPAPYATLVVAGSYRELLAGESTVLETGQVVLHPSGEEHGDLIAERGVELLNLELAPSALARLGPAGAAFERRRVLPRGAAGPLLARLIPELTAPDDLTPLVIEGALLELGARALRRELAELGAGEPGWLRRLDRLLERSFAEPWTLAALAAEVGVHPHHLSRAVRRHRRTTVGAWLRRLRTDHAALLLRSTLPIVEVALRAGFCDQSHLNRCFARRFGTSPAAWRRAVRTG